MLGLAKSLFTDEGKARLKGLQNDLKALCDDSSYKALKENARSRKIVDDSCALFSGLLSCWTGITEAKYLRDKASEFSDLIDLMGANQGYIFSANDPLSFKTAEVFYKAIQGVDLTALVKKEALSELEKINPNLRYIFQNFQKEFKWRLGCFELYLTKDQDSDNLKKFKDEIKITYTKNLPAEEWSQFVEQILNKIQKLPLLICSDSSHINPKGEIEQLYFNAYQRSLMTDLLSTEGRHTDEPTICLNAVKELINPKEVENFDQQCRAFFVDLEAALKKLMEDSKKLQLSDYENTVIKNLVNKRVFNKLKPDNTHPLVWFSHILDFIPDLEKAINEHGKICRQEGIDPGRLGHIFNNAQDKLGKILKDYKIENDMRLLEAVQKRAPEFAASNMAPAPNTTSSSSTAEVFRPVQNILANLSLETEEVKAPAPM